MTELNAICYRTLPKDIKQKPIGLSMNLAMYEEIAPLLVAPSEYIELRNHIRVALGFPSERLALLIGIDGVDGAGKSSLAAWLSWQLEMPTINLDLYLIPDTAPMAFKTDQLAAVIESRLATQRPLIVEGILLLDAMAAIGRRPDLLISVEREGGAQSTMDHVGAYLERSKPHARASHVLTWSSALHDARVAHAHLRSQV